MRVYLDACCPCRPFDDQSQERIRLKAEAIRLTLDQCRRGVHVWVAGEVLEDEVSRDPRRDHRSATLELLAHASEHPRLTLNAIRLAEDLAAAGLRPFDALHVGLAESAQCGVFLTTDDRLLQTVGRAEATLRVRVENPVPWLLGLPQP